MHLPPVIRSGGVVDRRAHERVPEPHPATDLDQPGRLGGRGRVAFDAELLGRSPEHGHVADRLGRGREQKPLRLGRQRFGSPQEALLDAAHQRRRVGQPEATRHLCRREGLRQLQQRERVAAGLGQDPVPDPLVEPPREPGREQLTSVVVRDPLHNELRQTVELLQRARLAYREQDPDPLGQQAPCDECQRLRGSAVEPLGVVHQADERARFGGLCQQAEDRERQEKALRWLATLQSERHAQRILLRLRQRAELAEHRRAQLMQPGEGELHLRLHTRGSCDPASRRPVGRVFQQRRLADARLATHDQHRALPVSGLPKEGVQRFALALATTEHEASLGTRD
jgi:hypothetical protein